jgi:hypothetical protein
VPFQQNCKESFYEMPAFNVWRVSLHRLLLLGQPHPAGHPVGHLVQSMAGEKNRLRQVIRFGGIYPLQRFLTSIIVQRFRLSVEQLAAVDD